MRSPIRIPWAAAAILGAAGWLAAAEPQPDLSDYRTAEQAVTTRSARAESAAHPRPGFLGVLVAPDPQGRLTVGEVAIDSPAARAGVQRGDRLLALDGQGVTDEEGFHDLLRARSSGETVALSLTRRDERRTVRAALEPLSRPMALGRQRAVLGVQVATVKQGEGVRIEQVAADSPAERARLKVGEVLLKIDDVAVSGPDKLNEFLAARKPDDTVTLTLLLAEKPVEMKVRLAGERVSSERGGGGQLGGYRAGGDGFGGRRGLGFGFGPRYWTRPVFRLGIICVEYPDAKHNPKITTQAWEDAMFSHGTYTKTGVTGQTVYGSMYDYYLEQSFGALKIEGKAFDYVEVSKKKNDYATGSRMALLTEALDKVLARDGQGALKDLDGVFFIYAGERPSPQVAPRGSLYWPHRASVSHNGKRWPYFICPEGGARMTNNSVFCHEFGHMLGLPDLYARPENPGMEGAGVWSAMANQVNNGRPQHFCAWCKEKLGWIKPTVIDPTVKQKLVLAPVEDSPRECFKVLVRPDGSEYFLLENRHKKGFDQSLPADGLLIWRVVGNRPVLEESHGVEGPAGPRVFLNHVPFPSTANDSFTPYTTPSSRSQLGDGGLPVYITNIRRLADGRITFHIGYEYH
jgi:M6 family metalloprotease-like protein